MTPSFPTAEGVSPSLCLMSPLGWEPLKALPARLPLLLGGGETSGLRSAWVVGLFPVCFLVLATMVSPGKSHGGENPRRIRKEKTEGCELSSPTLISGPRICPFTTCCLMLSLVPPSHLMKLRPLPAVCRNYKELLVVTMTTTSSGYHTIYQIVQNKHTHTHTHTHIFVFYSFFLKQ